METYKCDAACYSTKSLKYSSTSGTSTIIKVQHPLAQVTLQYLHSNTSTNYHDQHTTTAKVLHHHLPPPQQNPPLVLFLGLQPPLA